MSHDPEQICRLFINEIWCSFINGKYLILGEDRGSQSIENIAKYIEMSPKILLEEFEKLASTLRMMGIIEENNLTLKKSNKSKKDHEGIDMEPGPKHEKISVKLSDSDSDGKPSYVSDVESDSCSDGSESYYEEDDDDSSTESNEDEKYYLNSIREIMEQIFPFVHVIQEDKVTDICNDADEIFRQFLLAEDF